jgi:cytosine/adenosine deaminase-related metal-dependent hydrolase
MRKIGANYIFTGIKDKPWIKNGYIAFGDDGTVWYISDDFEAEKESAGLEFYSGYLVPGFVNAHLHLELSYLKDSRTKFNGLHDFIAYMAKRDEVNDEDKIAAARFYDNLMYDRGIVLAADIVNTDLTLDIKKESHIKYVNFIEVFGLSPENARQRMDDAVALRDKFKNHKLLAWFSPHSTYSISFKLFDSLRMFFYTSELTSIHFLEGREEKQLFENKATELEKVLKNFSNKLPYKRWKSAIDFVVSLAQSVETVLFVHNLFANKNDITKISKKFKEPYFVLCPSSNLNVEGVLPDAEIFFDVKDRLLIGTDSLVTNDDLDIVKEINLLLQAGFDIETLLFAATVNGAKALGFSEKYGNFDIGKKPGAVILQKEDSGFVLEKTIKFV